MPRISSAVFASMLALAAAPAAAQYGGSPDQQIDPPAANAGKDDDSAIAADPRAFDKDEGYEEVEGPPPPPEVNEGDGPVACRRSDGTTGIIVGGGAGALVGRGIDRRGERSTGTILGAVIGALIGHAIEQGAACR